jgi:hypothetical protein
MVPEYEDADAEDEAKYAGMGGGLGGLGGLGGGGLGGDGLGGGGEGGGASPSHQAARQQVLSYSVYNSHQSEHSVCWYVK